MYWLSKLALPVLSTITVSAVTAAVVASVTYVGYTAMSSGNGVADIDDNGQLGTRLGNYVNDQVWSKSGDKENKEEKEPPYNGLKLGEDQTKRPGKEFEWRGDPKTGKGSWVKGERPDMQRLYPDLDHPPPKKPHWDYEGPDGKARLNTDGTWEWK